MTHVTPKSSESFPGNVISIADCKKKKESDTPAGLQVHVASNGISSEEDEELDVVAMMTERIVRLVVKQALNRASSTELLELDYQLQTMNRSLEGRVALHHLFDSLPSLTITLSETLTSG